MCTCSSTHMRTYTYAHVHICAKACVCAHMHMHTHAHVPHGIFYAIICNLPCEHELSQVVKWPFKLRYWNRSFIRSTVPLTDP